jgi:hypothetical protein
MTTKQPQGERTGEAAAVKSRGVRRLVAAVAILGAAFLLVAMASVYAAIWTHGERRQSWLVTAAVSAVIGGALVKTAARIVEEVDR